MIIIKKCQEFMIFVAFYTRFSIIGFIPYLAGKDHCVAHSRITQVDLLHTLIMHNFEVVNEMISDWSV